MFLSSKQIVYWLSFYIGIGFFVVGIAYKYGLLDWFGNLSGDIKYQTEHTFVFILLVSMLLVLAVISLMNR